MKREALKFLVFADFHYSKNGYPSTIAQLEQILARGEREKVDLVLHAGDFANNYKASPEATRAMVQNKYGFEVAGVAGNHELESENTWDYVIPRLSNIKDRVFGNGTVRTLHPDNMAAGPASYGMTDMLGRMHGDAQFAGSSSVPAHVEMMGLIGAGNNPMVGMTVAVAVAIEEASK